LPNGGIRVTYDDPGSQFIAEPVDMIGPAPLELPKTDQTKIEHNAWLFRVLAPNGQYRMSCADRAEGLPSVEEEEIPDVQDVKLEANLDRHQHEGQRTTLLVTVRNIGHAPAHQLSVHWVGEHEAPQPTRIGEVQARDLGGSMALLAATSFGGTLGVGESAAFVLDARVLDVVLSKVAALSPERYGISVRSGESEILRIDGRVVGEFLEGLDDS